MIIDYFPVLFFMLLYRHCLNKNMQLEKGVFSYWTLENLTIWKDNFLVNCSSEKAVFPSLQW